MKKKFLLGLVAMLLPLTTWAQKEFKVAVTGQGEKGAIIYAGDDTESKLTVTVTVEGVEKPLQVGTDYEAFYYDEAGEEEVTVRDAGTYTVKIFGQGREYSTYPTKSETFIVQKKQVGDRLTLTSREKTYGDDDQSVLATLVKTIPSGVLEKNSKGEDAERANFLNCLQVNRFGDTEGSKSEDVKAGGYTVFVDGKSADQNTASNYSYTKPAESDNVTLTINPKELTVTVASVTYKGKKYQETELTPTIVLGEDESLPFGDKLSTPTLSYMGTTELKDAGSYPLDVTLVPVDAKQNENHTTNVNNYSVSATILKIEQAILVITEDTEAEGYEEDWNTGVYGTVTADDVDYTDKFKFNEFKGEDSEVNLNLKMKREEGADANTYTIMPYVGENATDPITLDNGENTTALKNYKIVYAENAHVAFTITGKSIENIIIDVTDLAYQGHDFKVVDAENDLNLLTVKDGETDLALGTDYEFVSINKVSAEGDNAKNASEQFTVTIKGMKNYSGQKNSDNFTIAQSTLHIAAKTEKVAGEDDVEVEKAIFVGKTYGDPDFTEEEIAAGTGLLEKFFTVEGWKETEADRPELYMVRDAGETVDSRQSGNTLPSTQAQGYYYVRPSLDGENYLRTGDYDKALKNYKIDYTPGKAENFFKIVKKPATYHIAEAKAEYGETTPTFTVAIDGLIEADEEATMADLFEISKTPVIALAKDAEGKDVTAKNVGSYALEITNLPTDENPNTIVAKNYELTYDGYNSTEEEEGEAEETGHKNGQYIIEKAPLTITAVDQTITFAQTKEIEELLKQWAAYQNTGKQTVTLAGNKNSDGSNLRKLFTLGLGEGASTKATGVYKTIVGEDGEIIEEDGIIVILKKENDLTGDLLTTFKNYEITPVNGALTIEGVNNLELSGSEEDIAETIKEHDGAEVGTVTVKNLKNYAGYKDEKGNNHYGDDGDITFFEAEKWYTLVLPFDVDVRDLSAALGYAIVNVPDYDKANYDDATGHLTVYYKLEMQTVPANTLMGFKVDRTKELTAEAGLTFTNVKIEAPGENIIKNGAEFVPVYTKEVFNADNGKGQDAWYLWPAAGSFYCMRDRSFTVYPLNGYIHSTVEGATVRIFMQEADGTTTAINTITGEAINSEAAEGWYTVGGMKLNAQPTQKGVYINNGKKVVIK